MNLRKLIGLAAAIAVLAAGIWLMRPVDRPMPAVKFTFSDGSTLDSAELRGRSVLVNFWSVSCAICLRDMPHLTAISNDEILTARGLKVIGVAMPHDPPPAVIELVERLQPGYAIAVDPRGELAAAFGDVRVTPTTFLIDPAGNIRYSARGALDQMRVRATLLTF